MIILGAVDISILLSGLMDRVEINTDDAFADGHGHFTFAVSHNTLDGIVQTEREISRTARYCFNDGSCIPYGSYTTGDGTFSLSNTISDADLAHFDSYFGSKDMSATDRGNLIYAGQRFGFNPDGSLFVAGTGDGTWGYKGPNTNGWDPSSDFLYDYNPVNLLQSPYERTNVYTTLKYDINDHVQFYGDVLYSTYTSSNQRAESPAAFAIPVGS